MAFFPALRFKAGTNIMEGTFQNPALDGNFCIIRQYKRHPFDERCFCGPSPTCSGKKSLFIISALELEDILSAPIAHLPRHTFVPYRQSTDGVHSVCCSPFGNTLPQINTHGWFSAPFAPTFGAILQKLLQTKIFILVNNKILYFY